MGSGMPLLSIVDVRAFRLLLPSKRETDRVAEAYVGLSAG